MKKSLVFFSVFAFLGLLFNLIRFWPDGRLHIFFCDVGQGDGIYIRFPNNANMLIDGGPANKKILGCLSKAMPFYDRHIDVVLMTHPQADHMAGLVDVLQRYSLSYFMTPPVGNDTQGYTMLVNALQNQHALVKNVYAGTELDFGEAHFTVLWPERGWIASKMQHAECSMQNGICIVKDNGQLLASETSNVLGVATSEDLNHFSTIAKLSYGTFDTIFTGDGDAATQKLMADAGITIPTIQDNPIEVLKVPHHGSRTGLLESFLETVRPQLAVISVGRENRYGHPAEEILKRLTAYGAKILRTDEHGTVEVVSDGQQWEIH